MEMLKKTINSLQKDGVRTTGKKIIAHINAAGKARRFSVPSNELFVDVLFINGCDPEIAPHPPRYRITHQREQLEANGVSTDEVYYTRLSLEQVRNARLFVFFRCPYTSTVGDFIKEAKRLHKTVLYDIDDLVIDTKYTDTIPYVQGLSGAEKSIYDAGVIGMGRTLSLCDAAMTTTERLAEELGHYVPEVFINRNVASEHMLMLSDKALENKNIEGEKQNGEGKVSIGYFSGSITHNADIALILPILVRILRERPNVLLHVVGELNLPEELKAFQTQIIRRPFVNWEKLPELIASVDINLAPLEASIFNEAKSENKWVEAALVKVPTVASNVGAFRRMIVSGETGLLCDTETDWYHAILTLIDSVEERTRLAENAWRYCREHCVTLYTGHPLANYIRSKMTPNAAFILPSLNISGGIIVSLRHAGFLYDRGFDVTLVIDGMETGWREFEGYRFSVVSLQKYTFRTRFDKAVATMWTTVSYLEAYANIGERYYLVQNFEPDFYQPDNEFRIRANRTYNPAADIQFITISRWCQNWLLEKYGRQARYAPNGLESAVFLPRKREMNGKIRILIEGDCGSYYKNVDESFQIVDRLDPERFEVWYMSYKAEPKPYYRVDRFLHCVPHEKVFEVYRQCDILVKSSILESFSYPPLEMMASGGYCVVAPNGGNMEYLIDEENCLLYAPGDIDAAVMAINRICSDAELRDKLERVGLETAESRDWSIVKSEVLKLYGE